MAMKLAVGWVERSDTHHARASSARTKAFDQPPKSMYNLRFSRFGNVLAAPCRAKLYPASERGRAFSPNNR